MSIMLSAGLSLGVGFGFAGFLGLPVTQMSFLAIFILLGVGIDDMFILVDAFEREGKGDHRVQGPFIKAKRGTLNAGCG